jgi:ribosomal protein S27AE
MPENLDYFDLPEGLIEIHCPECGTVSLICEWLDGLFDCGICGELPSLVCPECGRSFDHVHDSLELEKANL